MYVHWRADPVIFRLGAFSLRYYSVLFAGGIVFSYLFLQKIFRQEGMDSRVFEKFAIYIVAGTVAGARLGHCLFYEPGYFLRHPLEIILPWQGMPWTADFRFTGYQGLASHGGALGIFLAVCLFSRKYPVRILWLLDRLSLVVPVAGAMIRLGNLMNSEIIGSPSELPWAFVFERVDNLPRHPSQLYEALLYLSLFCVLYRLYKKTKSRSVDGILFGWFLTGLFLIRFFVEFFKANQEAFENALPLDMGQLLSIPFIIAGVILLYKKLILKPRQHTENEPAAL
ncbi:prolipoprotein diacylglyceryl transferase [Compostibacter hankyongensis]|uniref:Phosphatidylglycerol--prolipoprotein diacylglyceryl transferase n=2 Tax=Compostibacter hankyongensis TaxID=1007089 RepID=A0ABP8FZL4_9BACT